MPDKIGVQVKHDETTVYLTREEIEDIVSSAIRSAFRDLGLAAGSEASLDELNEFRADQQFLRDWRELCEMMRHKGVATAILMFFGALGTALLLGVKAWFLH